MLLKEDGKGTSRMQDVELLLGLPNKLKILLSLLSLRCEMNEVDHVTWLRKALKEMLLFLGKFPK